MDLKIKTITSKRCSILTDEENKQRLQLKVNQFIRNYEVTKGGIFYYVYRKQKLRLCADIFIRLHDTQLEDLLK